ncbi:MAG: primosomal protein N' [Proteobacteria bacterium]|nr:primosomal protein N' [Pseudomonadota bacterium]
MTAPLFASRSDDIVRVALPVPVDSLFDYRVPRELDPPAQIGCRVLVRFGGRTLTGVVVEPGDDASRGDDLAPLLRVLDSDPALAPSLIRVLRDAARDALCPVGIALATALPAGSNPRVVRTLTLSRRGRAALDSGALPTASRSVLESLAARPVAAAVLLRRPGIRRAAVEALQRDGLVEEERVERSPAVQVARIREARLAPGVDVASWCAGPLARAPVQRALLERVAAEGPVATRELGASEPLRALVRRGALVLEERAEERDVLGPPVARDRTLPELTRAQQEAVGHIETALRRARYETFLLDGVTGSGKTEVYLRAVAETLDRGRQALVLVPEITLTHQIVARLRARFGDHLAVLHSGLRPAERLAQWERLRAGETPIAVGARSALFAPLARLGLVVIDEEHDGAYKNDEGFRYHARNLAARRAREAGCPLILGSATPALETRHAADENRIRTLRLPRRIGGRPLPAVEIVDLQKVRAQAPRGRKLIVSPPLRRALERALAERGQSILFLNRRGFSTQVMCFDCGTAERCKNCDIALVFHADENALRCHYCDYAKPPPEVCTGCGAGDTALLGVGTERLEEEVRGLFPDARIARLDADTARRRGHTESVLNGLRAGHIDILLGTQIVAKGHDFPGVRLVGVVAADLGLHLPDFRAAERTFQLLTQVAGRAGRDAAPGRVVVQTFAPDHYAIRPVRNHDVERFAVEELAHRRALGYPPFGHLASVLVSSEDEAEARRAADALAAEARPAAGDAVELLGPAPAPLARLRRRHRVQLLVKGSERDAVHRVARVLAEAARRLSGDVRAAVDVNPQNLL